MPRKPPNNSASEIARKMQIGPAQPPPDVTLSEAERVVWDQMISIRDEWEPFDLVLMVKVVKLEVAIREHDRVREESQKDLFDGTNPQGYDALLKAQHTLQSQQLAVLTKMRIMEQRGNPRTLNAKSTMPDVEADESVKSLIAGLG